MVGVWFWSCVNKGYFSGLVGWGGRWLILKQLVKQKQNILFLILSFFFFSSLNRRKSLKWKCALKMKNEHEAFGVF